MTRERSCALPYLRVAVNERGAFGWPPATADILLLLLVPCYCPSKTDRSYKFSWILTLSELISIRILRMPIISAIMNFYWSLAISLQKLSNALSYKFSWILTLTEVISNRILRMRIISTIMNFYWSHAIALQKLPNERSYKFSWILTLTEVISIRSLKLIICYISSGATNIAEVSSGFHQADWSNTLVIVYCYLISFLFCFICLLFYLFLTRNLILCVYADVRSI